MRYTSVRSIRTTFALLGLAACNSGEPRQEPTSDLRLPSIDPGAVQLGAAYSGAAGQSSMPCLVRYDFAEPLTDVDCTVQQVNGPLDWEILCPNHAGIQAMNEFRFAADGTLLFGDGFTYGPVTFTDPACTVLETSATGLTTSMRCVWPDQTFPDGVPFPGDTTYAYSYDELDRLTAESMSFTATGVVWYDGHFTYDDAALRRDYDVVVDFDNRPGDNGGYDQLDDQLRLVEQYWFQPGDSTTHTYSYDSDGRLATATTSFVEDDSPEQSYSYAEHRIYDCQ